VKQTVLSLSLALALSACTAELCENGACETPEDTGSENAGLVSETIGVAVKEAQFNAAENGWVRVERWRDTNPNFLAENYPPDGRGNQDGQRLAFFDSAQPHSSKFLLYYAPKWDTNTRPVPVLLVHGANDHPDRAWANPNNAGSFGCGALTCPTKGLMQNLSGQGFKVFAIGFPHRQGDNLYWAEQVHDAIEIIKARTGSPVVDVVAWSKGVTAASVYASSLNQDWGTPYEGDIRRLLLLGGPNGGFDYLFRYGWNHNFGVSPEYNGKINAPMPHTHMAAFGILFEHNELSIFTTPEGNFFPGQKQMLARWDSVYPVPTTNQDWFTTYYGGQGFYTKGFGIQYAIDQGSLIAPIQQAGLDASIKTYLLCGTAITIPGIPNEVSGPSDGVVFIDSCLDDTGIPNVADTSLVAVNHLQLGWHTSAMSKISTWLKQP
jgi:hypothetical protein